MRKTVLGIKTDFLDIEDYKELIETTIKKNETKLFASNNMQGAYLYHSNPIVESYLDRADIVRCDGMPIFFIAKFLKFPVKKEHRITGLELLHLSFKIAEQNNWSVYYLGSQIETLYKAEIILKNQYPKLTLKTHSGFFDQNKGSYDSRTIISEIIQCNAKIIFIGMGRPAQERWVLNHLDLLPPAIVTTCGAAIEYVAQVKKTPPTWISKSGFEWLFRLIFERKNLWKRYTIEPLKLALLLFVKKREKGQKNRLPKRCR